MTQPVFLDLGTLFIRMQKSARTTIVETEPLVGIPKFNAKFMPPKNYAAIGNQAKAYYYKMYNFVTICGAIIDFERAKLFFGKLVQKASHVIVAQDAATSDTQRMQVGKLFLEGMHVASFASVPAQLCKLIAATRRTSGMVCDLGHSSRIYAMHNGILIAQSSVSANMTSMVAFVTNLLVQKGYSDCTSECNQEVVKNCATYEKQVADCECKLTDGTSVVIHGSERSHVGNLLFQNSSKNDNLVEAFVNISNNVPPMYQKAILSNILFTGGCSMIPGLKHRFYEEARVHFPALSFHSISIDSDLNGAVRGCALLYEQVPNLLDEIQVSDSEYTNFGASAIVKQAYGAGSDKKREFTSANMWSKVEQKIGKTTLFANTIVVFCNFVDCNILFN